MRSDFYPRTHRAGSPDLRGYRTNRASPLRGALFLAMLSIVIHLLGGSRERVLRSVNFQSLPFNAEFSGPPNGFLGPSPHNRFDFCA